MKGLAFKVNCDTNTRACSSWGLEMAGNECVVFIALMIDPYALQPRNLPSDVPDNVRSHCVWMCVCTHKSKVVKGGQFADFLWSFKCCMKVNDWFELLLPNQLLLSICRVLHCTHVLCIFQHCSCWPFSIVIYNTLCIWRMLMQTNTWSNQT